MNLRSAMFVMALLSVSVETALSASVFSTGSLGLTGITKEQALDGVVPASNVVWFNYVGARFQVSETSLITEVGGHFVGGFQQDSFFGAIIRLDSATDFPDSGDLSSTDVIGVAHLSFPHPSDEIFGELSVKLEPGWYAVVFGSALFQTDGRGGAVRNGEDIGLPSYINWQPSNGWFNLTDLGFEGLGNLRLVVKGRVIPEPAAPVTVTAIVLSQLLFGSRRRRNILNAA